MLAAALLLRAAVPAGWMPVAQADGIRIALCTANGPEFATLGQDGRLHKDAPRPDRPHDPCPFGLAAAQAADVPSALALPAAPALAAVLLPADQAAARLIARRSLRPPARGPPALA